MERKVPRLLIGGTHSGCGKTTVTNAVLQAFALRGETPAAFKCGPDYIDPMFHTEVIGAPSRNLDLYLCGADTVRALLAQNAARAPLAVIEGVMGYYDGIGATSEASACELARETGTPGVLVVSGKGMGLSAAALVSGFLGFRENTIRGVILNGISARMYGYYRELIERETGARVYGYLPRCPEAEIGSRHLGLVTAAEIDGLKARLRRLAEVAEECLDLDGLRALAESAPPLTFEPVGAKPVCAAPVRIGIARDRAFCFYYEDSLDLLRAYGAELVPFSPLADTALPPDLGGLYLGGGYPELYGEALSRNASMLDALRGAVTGGLPTLAECGGFMLLHERLADGAGRVWPMAGVIPGTAALTDRLQDFGYAELTARRGTLLCRAEERIRIHEFHYARSDEPGDACEARKPGRARTRTCVHASDTLFAGYPHLHFYANSAFAAAFVRRADRYRREHRQ